MKQALQTTKLSWLIYLMIMVVAINKANAQVPTITIGGVNEVQVIAMAK